jgi:glycerophosphoryl diester phosphodiesterase
MRRRRFLLALLVVLVVAAGGIYLGNASWLAPAPTGTPKLLAHRGVHQNFDLAGVTNDTCTATRIREPLAPEIENTLPSIEAAFDLGADVIELDVHPTTDGQFAVFHDWTLDCRTEGHGETRAHDMAYLKTLDVGFGYTADGGRTFPLRGKGVGMMPSLGDVMAAFPDGRFLINFKSTEAREGDMLATMVAANPAWRDRIFGVYGGGPPTDEAMRQMPGLPGYTLASIKACLLPYLALGWSGYLPAACRNTIVPVPINFASWLWGWPNRFLDRMSGAGSAVLLLGPYSPGDAGSSGIDTAAEAAAVPPHFDGYVWTNEIEAVAPLLKPGRGAGAPQG